MSQKPFLKSRFFKLPKHKRFDFPARYYNEEKENLEKRIKDIEAGNYESRIKNSFNRKIDNKSPWNSSWNTIRLIIIFAILIAGFLFIYSQVHDILSVLTSSSK